MTVIARCWVLVSDDDERCVTGIHTGDEPGKPLEDGFVWEEYVRADHHQGAVEALRDLAAEVESAIDARSVPDRRPLRQALDRAHAITGGQSE